MAAEVQAKLKAIKSKSPKVLTEKYQEVFDQLLTEQKDPQKLQEGVEAFLVAGKREKSTSLFSPVIDRVFLFSALVVDEGLGVVVAKALLSHFAEKVSQLDKAITKGVCEFALCRLLSRTVSFEEQVSGCGSWVWSVLTVLNGQATQVRLALAKIYEEEQNWRQSADILCGIPMDSGQKWVGFVRTSGTSFIRTPKIRAPPYNGQLLNSINLIKLGWGSGRG